MSRKHYRLSNGIVGRVSVVSLGHISEEMSRQMSWWHFERTGKHYRYQPGFHSKRPVTFPDGTKSGIDCRVIQMENVIAPRFKCSATHPKTGLAVDVIESSASAAANKILDLLDVNTNKRWSGPEFFGFTKPDVARELMKDSEQFLPEQFNKRKKFMEEKNSASNQVKRYNKSLPSHLLLMDPTSLHNQWNMVKYGAPKDMLFSNLYAPTMVGSLANETLKLENGLSLHSPAAVKLENGLPVVSPVLGSNHNSPTRSEADCALNGLLMNGNGHLVLNSLSNSTSTVCSPVTTNTSPISTGSRSEEALNVTWVELKCIGKPYQAPDHNWFYKHSNRRYRIQPGYRALRCARNSSNQEVFILSEVSSKEGRPLYRCSCKSSSKEDMNSTKVVQEFLKELEVPTKKSWSGPDFFGLTRSAVLQQLLATEQEEKLCAVTPTYIPNPISPCPSRPNCSLFEPLSQYLDSQGYRAQQNLKNPFSYPVHKLPTSSMNSPITGMPMPSLNGQLMHNSINSMLSPDMLSPRFIQNLPNFMSSNVPCPPVTNVPNGNSFSRPSFSRYMCVNMTECIRQLKLFITSLYTMQQDDKVSVVQLQKLNTDMERLMLLLKNETAELSQKIHSVDKKSFISPTTGYIKLECEGDGRLVDQTTETDPSSGINLELEKLSEVEVQCSSCQNSVTFCSGCGGRLALFVPGSNDSSDPLPSSPDKAEQAVSSSEEACSTCPVSPKSEIKSSWNTDSSLVSSPPCKPVLAEHPSKKIKLNNKLGL